MTNGDHNKKESDGWVKFIAAPLGIVMFAVFFIVIGIGAPVMFFGSIIQMTANGDLNIGYALIALISAYVAWGFWTSFITPTAEQFKSFKEWFNRK